MIPLLAVFSVLHTVFYLMLLRGWRRMEEAGRNSKDIQRFSVIIPARNEAGNITALLEALESQEYQKDAFEVIVVDDFSEDETASLVQSFAKKSALNLHLVSLVDPEKTGKKQAITRGVEASSHPILLTTDADCALPATWIAAYNEAFHEGVQMVTGPVLLTAESIFGKWQQAEFAGLMGFGAVALEKGSPTVCSGANLGFRRTAFEQVGGYTDNLSIPSGDDEFLMHGIFNAFGGGVSFMKDAHAIVSSHAKDTLKAFINQRVRWVSKWRFNKNKWVRMLSILFFLDFGVYLISILAASLGITPFLPVLGFFLLRTLVDFSFVYAMNQFLGRKTSPLVVMLLQIFYPVHVLFMGMQSIFGSYTWKGRKYG